MVSQDKPSMQWLTMSLISVVNVFSDPLQGTVMVKIRSTLSPKYMWPHSCIREYLMSFLFETKTISRQLQGQLLPYLKHS